MPRLTGWVNGAGHSNLYTASICEFDEAQDLIKSGLLDNDFEIKLPDLCPIHAAVKYGRPHALQALLHF